MEKEGQLKVEQGPSAKNKLGRFHNLKRPGRWARGMRVRGEAPSG
jgi:hypothetical protein